MRTKSLIAVVAAFLLAWSIGCSQNKANTPDVKDQVSQALDSAGFKDLSVDVNNDKQLVTIKGDVKTQDEKDRAEQVAKQAAASFAVSNEVGVRPMGEESEAKKIDSNLDSAIEKDFEAALVANKLDKRHISYSAKNGVLTLKGDVANTAMRDKFEKLASSVPNVEQVVNELEVKGAKHNRATEPSGQ